MAMRRLKILWIPSLSWLTFLGITDELCPGRMRHTSDRCFVQIANTPVLDEVLVWDHLRIRLLFK